VLVNENSGVVVAESHRRKRGSFFGKPRDMSLEISEAVTLAADVILLTFMLVWEERQHQGAGASGIGTFFSNIPYDYLDPVHNTWR